MEKQVSVKQEYNRLYVFNVCDLTKQAELQLLGGHPERCAYGDPSVQQL